MDCRELYRALEKIRPQSGEKEKIWDQLSAEMDGRSPQKTENFAEHTGSGKKRRIRRSGWAAAAVIICVLLIPGTVFADNIKDLFRGLLTREENVSEYVQKDIYTDSDGHVKIRVVEMLSDESDVLATIKFEALDEEGRSWLNGIDQRFVSSTAEDILDRHGNIIVELTTDFKGNTLKYGVNMSSGVQELEEYRTEDSRTYFASVEGSGWTPALANCQLRYLLKDGLHEVDIDTSANVPVYEYKLKEKDGKQISSYYEPVMVRVSGLSYEVLGKQKKKLYENRERNGCCWTEWFVSAGDMEGQKIRSVRLIKKDGSYVRGTDEAVGPGSLGDGIASAWNGRCDLFLAAGGLQNISYRLSDTDKEKLLSGEPEEFAGIEIVTDGGETLEYEFVR